MVYRVYVEKKPGLDHEAQTLKNDLKGLLGVAGLEKLLGRKEFKNLLSDLVVKQAGKPVLVQDTDPRPEFNTAQIDFYEEN